MVGGSWTAVAAACIALWPAGSSSGLHADAAWSTAHTGTSAEPEAPPVYKVQGCNGRDVGRQIGARAAARIRGWLRTDEIAGLSMWATTNATGRGVLRQLIALNTAAFPEYAAEVEGVAEGAGVDAEAIWVVNLIEELESMHPRDASPQDDGVHPTADRSSWPRVTHRGGRGDVVYARTRADHCSDVYVGHRAHGHNEDWSADAARFYYFLELSFPDYNCTGLAYPGSLLGNAVVWGDRVYSTQNALFPRGGMKRGLAAAFVQRQAVCGPRQHGAADAVRVLTTTGAWALGASINVVDLVSGAMVSVETRGDLSATRWVLPGANYTHFNVYKHPSLAGCDVPLDASSVHRQARADALPAPTSAADIAALLSDTHDRAYPIYRGSTLATVIVDVDAQLIRMWAGRPARSGAPTLTWSCRGEGDRG